ncbi:response regulator transcription factor [Bosea sp. NPDC003192]|uniref:response regulator transcription factor n=1 Tax=Bosea sp. NPDC003192 TaxID=3390551 RepID=UPI003D04F8D7
MFQELSHRGHARPGSSVIKKLLLIEDDDTFAILLAAYFRTAGYAIERVASANAGLRKLEREAWDAIIVDLTLPDEDGIVLTRMLRARSTVPIIVSTGRSGREDRLAALEIGADDFVTKPFEPRELVLRLNNILRRSGRPARSSGARLPCAGGELDLAGQVLLSPSGDGLDLGASEFALLKFLARNLDRVVTRAQIIDAVADGEPPESERAIDVRISRLRRRMAKLGLDASLLKTVHGSGYKLASPRRQPEGAVSSRSSA